MLAPPTHILYSLHFAWCSIVMKQKQRVCISLHLSCSQYYLHCIMLFCNISFYLSILFQLDIWVFLFREAAMQLCSYKHFVYVSLWTQSCHWSCGSCWTLSLANVLKQLKFFIFIHSILNWAGQMDQWSLYWRVQ